MAPVLKYGIFLQNVVDFLIISICIYVFVKLIGKFRRRQEAAEMAAPPPPSRAEELLEEIRDLLKEKNGG